MKLTEEEFKNNLQIFRVKEDHLNSVIMLNNPLLIKFCGIYPSFKPVFNPIEYSEEEFPDNEEDLWYFLWLNVETQYDLMCQALDSTKTKMEQLHKQLMLAKVIYPDGSITKIATGLVKTEIRKALRGISNND